MRTTSVIIMSVLLVSGGLGCGSDTECSEDEVEVAYLGTSDDRTECRPIPAECGPVAECAVNACISALYDLCEAPAFGVACSDTFPPTIVSCNE